MKVKDVIENISTTYQIPQEKIEEVEKIFVENTDEKLEEIVKVYRYNIQKLLNRVDAHYDINEDVEGEDRAILEKMVMDVSVMLNQGRILSFLMDENKKSTTNIDDGSHSSKEP